MNRKKCAHLNTPQKAHSQNKSDKISVYICCHKQVSMPKMKLLHPIQVGKEIAKIDLGMLSDNIGDNISKKNKNYCELTATYWIWKNVKDNIVGLCHYRRYFNFINDFKKIHKIKPNFAEWTGNTADNLSHIFKTYDIILPEKPEANKHIETLYDCYKQNHFISDLDTALQIIKQKHPKEYETANKILHTETQGYFFNMLIAKKTVFDNYAKWLFDILFELEKRIQSDVATREPYQQRVYGFLAERLMTVYIALHPELKVKVVPVIFVEEDTKVWRRYIVRYWKRKILQKLGLRKKHK